MAEPTYLTNGSEIVRSVSPSTTRALLADGWQVTTADVMPVPLGDIDRPTQPATLGGRANVREVKGGEYTVPPTRAADKNEAAKARELADKKPRKRTAGGL